jgi:hypothetical protein
VCFWTFLVSLGQDLRLENFKPEYLSCKMHTRPENTEHLPNRTHQKKKNCPHPYRALTTLSASTEVPCQLLKKVDSSLTPRGWIDSLNFVPSTGTPSPQKPSIPHKMSNNRSGSPTANSSTSYYPPVAQNAGSTISTLPNTLPHVQLPPASITSGSQRQQVCIIISV